MKKLPIYQVDAFSNNVFGGNPAAVCPLDTWPKDEILSKIAKENNLAETAYFIENEKGFHLRWFTPEVEMDLCGHATLASAHVIYKHLGYTKREIHFNTLSGELIVKKERERYQMDFPSRKPELSDIPNEILDSLNKRPNEIRKARDYFLIFDSEDEVRNLEVDQSKLAGMNLGTGGIICTAKGNQVDFVSRFFTPGASVFEDPVTGSAHCSLIPYWSELLDKDEMIAHQVSERMGIVYCVNQKERVLISGEAVTYLEGTIEV
jgi:PhzF family phenazine biosynthesis protein